MTTDDPEPTPITTPLQALRALHRLIHYALKSWGVKTRADPYPNDLPSPRACNGLAFTDNHNEEWQDEHIRILRNLLVVVDMGIAADRKAPGSSEADDRKGKTNGGPNARTDTGGE